MQLSVENSLKKCLRLLWLAVCALAVIAGTVQSQTDLNVWSDVSGHLWAENSYYRWDVTGGTELVLKMGTPSSNWRVPEYESYRIELGDGGGNPTSPSYGICNMSDLTIQSIESNDTYAVAVLRGTIEGWQQPLALKMTFYAHSGLVRMDASVGSINSNPYPPAIWWRFSLVPGGNTNSEDYYHYSGQSGEAAFPYNSWTSVSESELQTVGTTDFVYLTDYDKDTRQGFAMIAAKQQTTDAITDINYGRGSILDYHGYGGYSVMTLHANAVVSPTVYWYFYETGSALAYQPVEDLINNGGLTQQTTEWCENFESYAPGTFPAAPWTYTGNNVISVDNSASNSGDQSLRVEGVMGSCWAGIAVHPIGTPFPVSVELAIRFGDEDLYGCNPFRSYLAIFSGPSWTQGPAVEGFVIRENGDFEARAVDYTVLTNLAANQWHTVRVEFSHRNNGTLQAKYWINGSLLGVFSKPWDLWMEELGYVHFGSIEGTAWFDDICVSPPPPPVIPVFVDIKPGSCPNPLNVWVLQENDVDQDPADVTIVNAAARRTPDRPGPEKSVVPAAILGTSKFDVSKIDPSSIRLAGINAVRWSIEDVATPVPIQRSCECNTVGADGYADLTLKFYKQDLVSALGDVIVGEYVPVKLTGRLLNGEEFEGEDCVLIVGNQSGYVDSSSPTDLTNYPNPFNPSTEISYSLPSASHVGLVVYNVTGQVVATLVDTDQEAGSHSVRWDAGPYSSGIYLYRLTAGEYVETKKMLLIK